MSNQEQNQIRYTVACVNEFARAKSLSKTQAFLYLLEHKALDFLTEFYDVEHTLSFDDAVSDMTMICQKNGGKIPLYRGSNVDIQKIELSKCRPNKDFGKGFYLTTSREQAASLHSGSQKKELFCRNRERNGTI